jgi:hypothetical protein
MYRKCCHNKDKYICKDCKSICKGTKLCEHDRQRYQCKNCNLPNYLLQLQRNNLTRVLKKSSLQKKKKTIEYLGCDTDSFVKYIGSKMTTDMNFNNIHLDHIKPVSRFNLNDEEEFKMCCHFTNFQPLFAKDNLIKRNRWSDEEDNYWKENIIYQT